MAKHTYGVSESLKRTCLCGINVTTFSRAFGWFLLIVYLSRFVFIQFVVLPEDTSTNSTGEVPIDKNETDSNDEGGMENIQLLFWYIETAAATLCVVLMLIGNYLRRPTLYWPYLVFAIYRIISITVGLGMALVGSYLTFFHPDEIDTHGYDNITIGFMMLGLSFGILIYDLCAVYFGFVCVNRSRKCLAADQDEQRFGI